MNKAIISGNACADPKITYTQDNKRVGKIRLAVRRPFARQDADTDFISCTAFEKKAEFLEKYVKKGTKLNIVGRIQTGSYKKADGTTVYTTDIIIEEIEFGESKKAGEVKPQTEASVTDGDWMIPDDMEDVPWEG